MSILRKRATSKRQGAAPRRFSPRIRSLLQKARMLKIRAGTDAHRFTGIWFVLLDERVFVRPYYDKASGWYRASLREPRGAIEVSGREIAVRTRRARGDRLWDAVDRAYAEKYSTAASRKWVRGFATARRRKTTTELLPR
jgi:hypothetical protein